MRRQHRSFYIGALAVTGVGLLGSAFISRAHADAWDKMTIVSVNEPIIAGNKVLDPGTYVWKLLDSPSNRHIVQIYDKDQRHLETTILAIPNYRLQPQGNTQFSFWETPAGVPKAVRAWFYPGDNFGQEFPYPKKLVAQLASAAPVPVPMKYEEPAPVSAPAPQPEAQPEPAPAPAPAPEPAPEPQAQTQQNTTPAPAPTAQEQTLPKTASFSPLIGLLGLGSLTLAGLLTLATKRA
jgi:outer membrane biosynthesis protein TonB